MTTYAESIKKRRAERGRVQLRDTTQNIPTDEPVKKGLQFSDIRKISKERLLYWSIGGFFALILIMLLFSCGPRQGTMMYGVCKVFLERMVPYPDMVQIRFVEQYPMSVRIGFNQTDTFGQYTYTTMECAFRPDEKTGLAMDTIWVMRANERKDVPQEIIEQFNIGIAAIVTSDPVLDLPPPMPKEIVDLKTDW
ncbi:MAG: hypothetical protein EOM26_02375 [Alphaproteobacteria bacterium]|nr:hypothetical protein [Alphaproteobacteria bacterium]